MTSLLSTLFILVMTIINSTEASLLRPTFNFISLDSSSALLRSQIGVNLVVDQGPKFFANSTSANKKCVSVSQVRLLHLI